MAVSISEDSREYSVPYEWKKLARRRHQTSQGNIIWDIYIIAPCGKKLCSNPEIEKYLSENPDVHIDRGFTLVLIFYICKFANSFGGEN